MAECLGVDCDFKGTQDEVDDHFVECIRIGEPGHARMPQSREPPPGFRGPVTALGECWHRNYQLIRLVDPDAGYATYCRDCHICIDWPYPSICAWAADAKCTALACDFEGTTIEVERHREAIRAAAHWTDPASVLVARDHGHIVAIPCEECGQMTMPVDMSPFSMDHTEGCSHHSTNVPEGRFWAEGGLGIDGKSRWFVNGVEQPPNSSPPPDPPPDQEDSAESDEGDKGLED
jgi:hypothetical protein